jgi:tRNA uridine 5-carboxymethylaminomethyl modification enzyme
VEVREIKRDELLAIPKDINYLSESLCLSIEEREKLMITQPQSIGAATRIPHITPSTVLRLLHFVKQNYHQKKIR